jgi:hypothetical protein
MQAVVPLVLAGAVALALLLWIRWFERYRMTEAWRHGDMRAAALTVIFFIGQLVGHRLVAPPRPTTEQTTGQPKPPDTKPQTRE